MVSCIKLGHDPGRVFYSVGSSDRSNHTEGEECPPLHNATSARLTAAGRAAFQLRHLFIFGLVLSLQSASLSPQPFAL